MGLVLLQEGTLGRDGRSLLDLCNLSVTPLRFLTCEMPLATIVQLGEVLHHSRQLDVRGISVTCQLPVKFLQTRALLFLYLVRLRNSRVASQSKFRQILGETVTSSMMTRLSTLVDLRCRRLLAKRNSTATSTGFRCLLRSRDALLNVLAEDFPITGTHVVHLHRAFGQSTKLRPK